MKKPIMGKCFDFDGRKVVRQYQSRGGKSFLVAFRTSDRGMETINIREKIIF
jgi:hypothetical protein